MNLSFLPAEVLQEESKYLSELRIYIAELHEMFPQSISGQRGDGGEADSTWGGKGWFFGHFNDSTSERMRSNFCYCH